MSSREVIVPDLLGLPYQEARRIGVGIGLLVIGVAPDGQPVREDSEGLVVEQHPVADELRRPGRTLTLRIGRPPSGDREPLTPIPPSLVGSDTLEPPPRFSTRVTDTDEDPVPV